MKKAGKQAKLEKKSDGVSKSFKIIIIIFPKVKNDDRN